MHYSADYLLAECQTRQLPLSEVYRRGEAELVGLSPEALDERMLEVLEIMADSSHKGLEQPVFSLSGMTGGTAYKAWQHRRRDPLLGEFVMGAVAMALSTSEVNASMGRIVAAPTAGASGILPAALASAKHKYSLTLEELLPALYTAGAIGKIIALEATVSGADGGCQAECGTAAAMAAAGLTELLGGSPAQCFHAAGMALIHVMGLVCDPIAGFVEFPCSLRNASGLVNAFVSADLAMAGIESLVPFDQVVDAMYRVGKMMPEALRETSLGGIAASPAAKNLEKKFL
ncbi:MAG TPA: L-serine ammonia-lyase, iron-sulfur-dependent, subunit alpha [Tissierellia bacterium]|nr:L-serine ammonia-lyase, iron-sulfur-dependent, subunit alpha [Tissierellia bacterium]